MSAIFVNLPVKDVAAARKFYTKMGFSINEQFSNEQSVAVVVDDQIWLLLVSENFFKENTSRDVADTAKVREVSLAIQVADRKEVDTKFDAAIAAGGKKEGEVVEDASIGMYSRGMSDLDGHKFDILCLGA